MDLHQIADHMFEREEKLSVHLGLTPADISNVKERNPFKPDLQGLAAIYLWESIGVFCEGWTHSVLRLSV